MRFRAFLMTCLFGLRLTRLLRHELARNTQLVYQTGFCLWLLSFNVLSIISKLCHLSEFPITFTLWSQDRVYSEFLKQRVVETMIDVVVGVTREKVIRIAFQLLRVSVHIASETAFHCCSTLAVYLCRMFAAKDLLMRSWSRSGSLITLLCKSRADALDTIIWPPTYLCHQDERKIFLG